MINMKQSSLASIEDSYIRNGYRSSKLRNILKKDKEYQRLLKSKRIEIHGLARITETKKKRYVLSVGDDLQILEKCKRLEKLKLTKEDAALVKLIKAQLEHDWRIPLIKELNRLMRKYK